MRRLVMTQIEEILYRWVKGGRIKKISKSLGIARNTVREIVREGVKLGLRQGVEGGKVEEVSAKIMDSRYKVKNESSGIKEKLGVFDGRIECWLKEDSMTRKQIYRMIRESGVETSVSSVERYIKSKFLCSVQHTIHLVTKAGEEAQVDYGYVGEMIDPETQRLRKAYVFVMILSHSRHRYVEFVFKQDERSWIQSHINAFKFFGGVPRVIILDNLKAGIVKADIYDPTINKGYGELERFYGFIADPAKVRKPQHKGKVERSILMVKQQLIAGRRYKDIIEANRKAKEWSSNEVAKEVTRSTGKTPIEIFEKEEKGALIELPTGSFDIAEWVEAKVHKDHHIVFAGNFYSIPTKYIGKEVVVRAGLRTLEVYYKNQLIKNHVRNYEKGQWVTDTNDYPESALRFLKKTAEKCLEEAIQIGEATSEVIKVVLQKSSRQKLRKAQAILRLCEDYTAERLEKACLRAYAYGNYSYKGIRNILEEGLENKIIEEALLHDYPTDYHGAYLRSAMEYKSKTETYYG
jgi:transposase